MACYYVRISKIPPTLACKYLTTQRNSFVLKNSLEDTICQDFAKEVPQHVPSIYLEYCPFIFLSFKIPLIFQGLLWICASFLGTPVVSYIHLYQKHVLAQLLSSCPTLCDLMDCSLSDSSVHRILQERILEWVVMPSSGDFPNPGIELSSLMSLALADRFFFTTRATWQALFNITTCYRLVSPIGW